MATRAPSRANATAIARPMPEDAPVTRTTRFLSPSSILTPSVFSKIYICNEYSSIPYSMTTHRARNGKLNFCKGVESELPKNAKTPLDYLGDRGELVPVQVRLPKELVDGVKARLQKHGMT